jgi:diguanylate cyclase (GGDEF)-like protein
LKKLGPKGPEAPPASSDGGKKLVLYVEDEAENREVTELRLRDRFELLWASNDREACAVIAKHHERLYAILMDIQLKGSQLDGVQLTKLLRGEALAAVPPHAQGMPVVDVPIIFVTAYGASYSEEQLIAVGGTHVVTKPVDFVDLTLALANAHARSVLRKLDPPRVDRFALKDPLTGLFNDKHFQTALVTEISLSQRRALGLLLIDIDSLAKYNERCGQSQGDRLLRQVSALLTDKAEGAMVKVRARVTDTVYRYGGGFAIIMPGAEAAAVRARAESIRAAIEEFPFAGREGQPGGAVTVSIGAAVLTQTSTGKDALIEAASQALAQAKRTGRNHVEMAR